MIQISEGFHADVPEAVYHLDPCPEASLSASIAKLLVNRSPRHAWFEHPRLNTAKAEEVDEATKGQDMGTAIHKVMLGKGRDIVVVPFADFRKDAAKAIRDEARAAGKVPILADDMDTINLCVAAGRDQLADTAYAGIFEKGAPEVTMAWREANGIWCRGRIDFLPDAALAGGHIVVPDFKTTGASAHPDDWSRIAFDMAYDIQAALYPRGLRKLIPDVRSVEFPFIVLEQQEPFGLSVVTMGGQAIAEAAEMVELAVKAWGACLKAGKWPSYATDNTAIDPPHWRSSQKELRRLALQHRIDHWQRPLEAA